MKDTAGLKNAYRQFGNVAYVDHWFKAPGLIGVMRPVVTNKQKDLSGKPKHWQRVIQLEYRPLERLNMNFKFDAALLMRNGRHINFDAKTAIELEKFARKKKQHDWRIEIIEAFQTLVYQRQGTKKWVLIEIGKGYA